MKILSIKTNGFRKFADEFNANLYEDVSYIYGGNHKGKTNCLFAIVWGLLGSNLTGDEKVCLAHKDRTECYVELVIRDNKGVRHTITRYKNKFNNSKNFITLDGIVVKQEELVNFYHNKSLFLSIINLSYFVGLQPAKQKEIIDKYLPDIDIKEVYEKLSKEDKTILNIVPTNIKLYISELDEEIKFIENKITKIKGQIEYAEKIASEELGEVPVFNKQQEYDFAYQELELIKNNKFIENKEKLEQELKKLEKEEAELKLDINNLENELQVGKKEYQNMMQDVEACCPTCKRKLDTTSKQIAIKEFKEKLLSQFDKQIKLKERYKYKHFDKVACTGKILSLNNCSNNISLETVKELEKNIADLENEKQETLKKYNEYMVKKANKEKAVKDIEGFNEEIKKLNNSILEIKKQSEVAKQLYFNSIKEKMNLADKYLEDVKIRFYKIVKTTGEIKDDFVITYKDKDF